MSAFLGYDQGYEFETIIKTMVPGPPGSVETDDMTDDNPLDSYVTTDNENETELMFNEDDEEVILLYEDEEHSSASSRRKKEPGIIKKKKIPIVLKKDQVAATVLSLSG